MLFHAYGMYINSYFDLGLLGLKALDDTEIKTIDLRIERSEKPLPKKKFLDNETYVDFQSGFYFRKNLALFEFISGNTIRIYPLKNIFDLDFMRVLLNYPIACIMFQRGFFSLHASAVLHSNSVYMFCGQSLSGKSSIAAKFLESGAKLITEDSAILKVDEGKAYIMPSYPFIKLSSEANEYIGFCDQNGLELPADKNQRRGYKLNKDQFFSKSIQVDYCFYLDWSKDNTKIEKEDLKNQYRRILEASLNIYPLSREKERLIFSSTLNFLKNVKTFRYMRQKKLTSLKNVIEQVESVKFSEKFF